ncbi:hypothetical protein AV274_2970 [Blastocystis sp. ATCC 50177/Nand II]|uniref:Uncharacterized protein n=1 Tax=Blastocystis sp. subtype 1 (strain ATCC 50177 / NandII) TaxID=478820 RepID=A0A196SG65_BLAHN|nr:hypothetical protein AV274_2970 [Blastocystis sp. ATCC 50177/Nand II]
MGDSEPLPCELILLQSGKRKEYISNYSNHIRTSPTCESVVRSAIQYPNPITGDAKQYDEFTDANPSTDRIRMMHHLFSFLQQCGCDIHDLSSFLTCDELVRYYSFLERYADKMGLSADDLRKCILRKKIATLWMEVNHYKSQRYNLRPSTRVGIVIDSAAVYMDLKTLITQFQFGEDPETKCMCFCCFVMGYYSFFQQDWANTTYFWGLSHYKQYHWEESTITLVLDRIANRQPVSEKPTPMQCPVDYSSISAKPCKSYSQTLQKHTCLASLENAPSPTVLVHYIQYHLSEWSNATSYFSNRDLRLNKESCYCFMMCLYLCGYISEVIAMNQYISFCNYSDVEMMLKSNDISDACIDVYSDVPLLQLLIHMYAERAVTCEKAKHALDLLMEQMQNPMINAFNDEMIISQEKLNLQKRLFRYLHWEFLINLSA